MIDRVYGLYWEIPPNQAAIVSFFNGALTVHKIGTLIASIYQISQDTALNAVCDTITLLSTHNLISLESTGVPNNFFWDPQEFIFASQKPQACHLYKSPVTLEFIVTHSCNFHCQYCYMGSSHATALDEHMDFKLFKSVAQQARDLDVKRAVLSGGEPLLCTDLTRMLKLLVSYDIFPYISTNGFLVTEEFVDNLQSLGVTFIHVSLDSPSPRTFDALTGRKGAFEAVKRSVEVMKDRGMTILAKAVITKKNFREAERLIDLCFQLGVAKLDIAPCIPSVRGRSALPSLLLSDNERSTLEEAVKRKREDYALCMNVAYSDALKKWSKVKPEAYCVGGISSLVIFPDGRAAICEMIPDEERFFSLGNCREESLAGIWRSQRAKAVRCISEDLLWEACLRCQYQAECRTGCFNLSKVMHGDYFAPDPRCPVRVQRLNGD